MPEKPQLPKTGVKRTAAKKGPVISVAEFLALKNPKGNLLLSVAGETVSLTSLERIYWPAEKFTKFDLLRYYIQIAPHLLPHLKDRPAILQRWPRGINAPMFFQQDLESAPSFVKSVHLTNLEGRELDYAVFSTTAALLHLVNLGNIEQHPWHSTTKKLSHPDWIALDLALLVKRVCDEVGLSAFPKTSGSSGIHIYLPLKPRNEYGPVAEFSRLLASEVASRAPKIATVERSLAKRGKDQVYVDWMQNARGKSLASVFTVRAKPGATVSMPLTWKQVEKGVKISDFNIKNVPTLIEKRGDAWQEFFAQRQTLKLK